MGTAVPQHRPGAPPIGENSTDSVVVSERERARLLDEFLARYCSPVFGGLSKREVDLLVFGLLIQTRQVDLSGGQQSISRFLRTPISKVKSLIYETQLRDEHCNDSWFRREVIKLLQNARLSGSKAEKSIKLGIENPMLRKELEAQIKELNGIADYSFNSDILQIDSEIYALLLRELISDVSEQSKLESALRSALKSKGEELSWKELLNELLKGAAHEVGSQVVDLTFGYFTGGLSAFTKSVKKVFTS